MRIFLCLVVCCGVVVNSVLAKDIEKEKPKRVCVIGAGVAGLSSARYLKEEGINFTVFEVTKYLGGTWRYDPRVGVDEHGEPIMTSMYKHLRTNLPKPTMELRGFPMPNGSAEYPSWEIVYKYIKDYAEYFDIEKYIKFEHKVVSVKRENDQWKVKSENLVTNEMVEEYFDFVVIGNGHHSKPNWPDIPGEKLFKGNIIHSHDYRVPDPFISRRVLIIGSGPSGMDISLNIAEVSSSLIHSHHSRVPWRTKFPSNYVHKPDVKEFNETGVIFVDGTFEEIDDVVYCTGFQYYYPFLDESSGLSLTPRVVSPLHLHMVNINQPSMIILGLVVRACLVVSLDAQARYMTALVKGNFTLPSHEEMMAEWQSRADFIEMKGLPKSALHYLAYDEDKYYANLTKESGIERVPPVLVKIRTQDMQAKIDNLYTYRNYIYTVIDDQTFIRTHIR